MDALSSSLTDFQIRLTSPARWYRCEPGWRWQPPAFTDYDLWFVAGGAGHLQYGGETWQAGPHDCFIIRPGTRLIGTQDPQNRFIVFAVHFEWLDEHGQVATKSPYEFPSGRFPVRDWDQLEMMARAAESCALRSDSLGPLQSAAWVRLMLLQLIAEAELPPPTPVDTAIAEIITLWGRDPRQWRSVEELAESVHLSPSQFTRRFRAATGSSPRHFFIRIRLERAHQLLQETEMTLEHIAGALGYRDVFFFARQYRQVMGEPPGNVRRRRVELR